MAGSRRDPLTCAADMFHRLLPPKAVKMLSISKARRNGALRHCIRIRVYKLVHASTNWQRPYVKPDDVEEGNSKDDRVLGAATSRYRPRRGCNVAVLEDR